MPRATITPSHDIAGHLAPFQAELSRRLGLSFVPAAALVAAWLVLPHAPRANLLGILALQGYLFARPMPGSELPRLLPAPA